MVICVCLKMSQCLRWAFLHGCLIIQSVLMRWSHILSLSSTHVHTHTHTVKDSYFSAEEINSVKTTPQYIVDKCGNRTTVGHQAGYWQGLCSTIHIMIHSWILMQYITKINIMTYCNVNHFFSTTQAGNMRKNLEHASPLKH